MDITEKKIRELLKDIKSDKPLKYSLYINKNGINLLNNPYYSGVSYYELYGKQKLSGIIFKFFKNSLFINLLSSIIHSTQSAVLIL